MALSIVQFTPAALVAKHMSRLEPDRGDVAPLGPTNDPKEHIPFLAVARVLPPAVGLGETGLRPVCRMAGRLGVSVGLL